MSGTKILWGQVIVVGLIVLLAIWGATEWTAWRLAYQPELGRPWFVLSGWKIYYPPIFFWWWFVYDAYAPQVFVEGAFIAASGTFISIAVAIGMSVWRAREAVQQYADGNLGRREDQELRGRLRVVGQWRRDRQPEPDEEGPLSSGQLPRHYRCEMTPRRKDLGRSIIDIPFSCAQLIRVIPVQGRPNFRCRSSISRINVK